MSAIDPVVGSPGEIALPTAYGATTNLVSTWMPQYNFFDADSVPTAAQVQQFITNAAALVNLSIGDLDRLTGTFATNVITQAQVLVTMKAAAWAQDAGFPEHVSGDLTGNDYGARLHTQFDALLDKLAATVSRGPAEPDTGPQYPDLGVAWEQPTIPLIADVGGVIVQDWSDPYAYPNVDTDEVQTEIDETSGFDTDYSQGESPEGGIGEWEDIG